MQHTKNTFNVNSSYVCVGTSEVIEIGRTSLVKYVTVIKPEFYYLKLDDEKEISITDCKLLHKNCMHVTLCKSAIINVIAKL